MSSFIPILGDVSGISNITNMTSDNYNKIVLTISIIFILCILTGLFFLYKPSKYSESVIAEIENANSKCTSYTVNGNSSSVLTKYICNLNLSYVVNGVKYNNKLTVNDVVDYTKLNNIQIFYKKNNPNDCDFENLNMKKLGADILFYSIFIFVLILTFFKLYQFFKNKKILYINK